VLCACHTKPTPIAELTEADGLVERQRGGAWSLAVLGTQYFLGDAARTAEHPATLMIGGASGAQIAMQGHTVLRFGGVPGASQISVESGAIDLAGTGSYGFDVGAVTLAGNSTVHITAKGSGRSSMELMIGAGRVAAPNGQSIDLAIGTQVEVGREAGGGLDAGVPDAVIAPTAPADAAVDAGGPEAGDVAIEVTGKQARWQAAGEATWTPLPAGAHRLLRGSALRLGAGTAARAITNTMTLDFMAGARLAIGDDLGVALEAGSARAAVTSPASLAVPGGVVALDASPATPAELRLDASPRETKVTMLRGTAELTGAAGAHLGLSRGESAALQHSGAIRVIEAIPSYFDLRIVAGESLTIHDPRPPTAVQFQFDGKCPGGGIIELDRDGRFLTAKVSGGRERANAIVTGGAWYYRLRCTTNGADSGTAASGRIATLRDDGRRPLPRSPGVNDIDADGRNYRISYQSAIPSVRVRVQTPGANHKLHLASGGKELIFESRAASITVPGGQLREGTYTYWIDRDGVKQDRVSTLTIDFDQTAPQVYIESPVNAQPWSGDIDVRGAVLPGWSAAVESLAIPIDPQRRFAAKVGVPSGNALAIRLSHPQRGVHYYLRRPR
jgi:hypothetical protein